MEIGNKKDYYRFLKSKWTMEETRCCGAHLSFTYHDIRFDGVSPYIKCICCDERAHIKCTKYELSFLRLIVKRRKKWKKILFKWKWNKTCMKN